MEDILPALGFWYAIFFIVVVTFPYWFRGLGVALEWILKTLWNVLVWLVQLPSIQRRPDRGWSKVPLFSAEGWRALKWKFYSEETRQRFYEKWARERQARDEARRQIEEREEGTPRHRRKAGNDLWPWIR
jgi:hypothetical protein